MRLSPRLLPLLVLVPCATAAQTTTDDGIRAFVQRDYRAAARILRPLAEDASAPDRIAQFFMGLLYEGGLGVGRNELRACGFFLNAAAAGNPFQQQSSALAQSLLGSVPPSVGSLCAIGLYWRDPPPTSFVLGPNHSIAINDTSTVISYNGTEHRTMTGGGPGLVYLPIRYTPLDVSSPVSARRHFIHYFIWSAWSPVAVEKASAWTLGWTLFEVVGGDLVRVAGEPLATAAASSPPPTTFDVDSVVQVRVDANGEAEMGVTGGSNPRSSVIPWNGSR